MNDKIKLEVRVHEVEMASDEASNDELVVSGYANKTNQLSEVLGKRKKFRERILPGTFKRAIENATRDIHMLLSHDDEKVLASTRNGSLIIEEDDIGLRVEARISPTSYGRDAYQLVKDGILTNMSFGMIVNKDEWRQSEVPGLYERTITDLSLFEVSIVRDPAYTQTVIAARGLDMVEDAVPEELLEEENRMNEEFKQSISEMVESFKALVGEVRSLTEEVQELRKAQQEQELEDAENRDENGQTEESEENDEDSEDDEAEDDSDGEDEDENEEEDDEERSTEPRSIDKARERLNKIKEETHNE